MSDTAPRRRALSLSAHRHERDAFTLVELLVVIGIIAALIGILLPVLSGVQARGRDIKCQSNLRQILQGILMYATENKGSMPYGLYWVNSDPTTWEPSSGDFNDPYISWISQVSMYMGRKTGGITDQDEINKSVSPVFQCPEAQQAFPHPCSYVMNFIVGIAPYYEFVVGTLPNAQVKPPLQTQMLKGGTALIWDTAVQPSWERNDGFLLGADIDGQRFWDGAHSPQFRYFSLNDVFGQIPPGVMGNNRPVRLNVGSFVFTNIDPRGGSHYPWQGNLRFRHTKGTTCNVGYSDGHVDLFRAKLEQSDRKLVKSHDARRRYFMIKWPTGAKPNPSFPH